MKGWIKLHLLCDTNESDIKRKMGIDIKDDDLKYNPYHVQISNIGSIGLCIDTGGSFLNICCQQTETKESPDKILDMITRVSVNV